MSNNHKNLSSSEVIARLFEIIPNISEANRRQLLEVLEKKIESKFTIRRKHARRPYKIPVDFSIDDFPFSYCTHNLSKSGAYIETDLPFLTHKELSMKFNLPSYEKSIKTTGRIVRTDSNGIGVQFKDLLPTL